MAKKLKVPKRVAGVKIPKAVRKGPVGTFLNSTSGRYWLPRQYWSPRAQ